PQRRAAPGPAPSRRKESVMSQIGAAPGAAVSAGAPARPTTAGKTANRPAASRPTAAGPAAAGETASRPAADRKTSAAKNVAGKSRAPSSPARAAASRANGAKSRGPKTAAGKARSAQNAIKHGLRAIRHCVLPQEDPGAFDALQYAMFAELQPAGVMEVLLARRVAVAAWRLARADRMEAEALAFRSYEDADAGLALMRDCNGARAID